MTELKKLPHLDLTQVADLEGAAKLIFRENLGHMQQNLDLFLKKDEGRALMQIRIATRRIRVAMYLFQNQLRPTSQPVLKEEFAYFGRSMGLARDLDVLLFGLLGPTCPLPDIEEDYRDLRQFIELEKNHQFEKMRLKLQEDRFQELLSLYDHWSADPFARSANSESLDLREFALRSLEDARMQLVEKNEELDRHSFVELHKLRKYVKRYRYFIRFFASLIKPAVVARASDIITPMQDCLGDINDAHVGSKILQQTMDGISDEKRRGYLQTNAKLLAHFSNQANEKRESYDAHWQRFQTFKVCQNDFI